MSVVYIVLDNRDPVYANKDRQKTLDFAQARMRDYINEEGMDLDDIYENEYKTCTHICHPQSDARIWVDQCQYHEQ